MMQQQPPPQPQFVTTLPAPPPGMVYGLMPAAGAPPAAGPVFEVPGSTPATASPAASSTSPALHSLRQPTGQVEAVAMQQPFEPAAAGAQVPVHQVNDLYENAPEPR
jgi:hypothetical protein